MRVSTKQSVCPVPFRIHVLPKLTVGKSRNFLYKGLQINVLHWWLSSKSWRSNGQNSQRKNEIENTYVDWKKVPFRKQSHDLPPACTVHITSSSTTERKCANHRTTDKRAFGCVQLVAFCGDADDKLARGERETHGPRGGPCTGRPQRSPTTHVALVAILPCTAAHTHTHTRKPKQASSSARCSR